MADIVLDILDAQGPSGAQFVARNAKGAEALAKVVNSEVTVGQAVRVDGWVYKDTIAKLRRLDATVLNYSAFKNLL